MLLEIQDFHLCLEKFMFLLLVVCMILTVRGVLGVYFQCKPGCVHSPSQLIMHFYINVQINPWFIAKGFWLFISTYNSLKSKVRKNKSLVIIRREKISESKNMTLKKENSETTEGLGFKRECTVLRFYFKLSCLSVLSLLIGCRFKIYNLTKLSYFKFCIYTHQANFLKPTMMSD